MKKITILLFFIFLVEAIVAQNIEISPNKRYRFVPINQVNEDQRNRIIEQIGMMSDTLVNLKTNTSQKDIDYFCECFKIDSIVDNYYQFAFTSEDKKSKSKVVYQWNTDIVIFFDKQITREIRLKFKQFFKPIEQIKNLSISYSNNRKKSNYHILVSDSILRVRKNLEGVLDEKSPQSRVSYHLVSDGNFKYYSGKLLIDLEHIEDKSLILLKLKQHFFLSLGRFHMNTFFNNKSLIHGYYEEPEVISNEDISLIKLHYYKLHDSPFTTWYFFRLKTNYKAICKND